MEQLREKRNLNRPPPNYKPVNEYLTIVFHYGGKLEGKPYAQYVGGDRLIVDYVVTRKITMLYLKNLLGDWLFMDGELKLLHLKNNSFNLVSSDGEVKDLCLSSLGKREVHFFVQEGGLESNNVLERETFKKGMEVEGLEGTATEMSDLGTVSMRFNDVGTSQNVGGAKSEVKLSDDDSDYIPESDDSECEEDNRIFDQLLDESAIWSSEESEEDDDVVVATEFHELKEADDTTIEKDPVFNPTVIFQPAFELGMIFSTRKEFKQAVQSYAIRTKRSLRMSKTDPTRVYFKCVDEDCEFHIHLRKHEDEETYQIREFEDEHTCDEQWHVQNLKSTWLCRNYLGEIVTDRTRKVSVFRRDMIADLDCEITINQAHRAKKLALQTLEGDVSMQYAKLWEYSEEIRRTNPGSTVIVSAGDQEQGDGRFERLYICFDAVKKGFKSGCRPIIGVDGCHLKGPYRGIMLTAVGVDANNGIYPIAWAVVSSECRITWEWFLVVLKQDLGIEDEGESHYTFMSDKQKGLIQAMSSVFPNVAHRFCVRHLHENFRSAGFRGDSFKNALWRAAQATTVGEWEEMMSQLKSLSEPAWEWLDAKPPKQWSKSHFSEHSKCDMLLNNVCEVFNSAILDARDMPIITMLEWIRSWLMVRFQKNRDISTPKWQGRICPRIKELLEINARKVSGCMPLKSDNNHYEIRCPEGSQYLVNLAKKTCSCRAWGLSGIPCNHAICAINHQRLKREDFVHDCYTVETYKKTYAASIIGVNGPKLWSNSMYIPPLPPKMEKGKGKQSMARRKGPDETADKRQKKKTKLRRRQNSVTCSKCGIQGHNVKGCGKEQVNKKKEKEAASSSGPQIQETDDMHDEMDSIPIESVTQLSQIPGPTMFQQLHGEKFKRQGPLILNSEKRFCSMANLQARND